MVGSRLSEQHLSALVAMLEKIEAVTEYPKVIKELTSLREQKKADDEAFAQKLESNTTKLRQAMEDIRRLASLRVKYADKIYKLESFDKMVKTSVDEECQKRIDEGIKKGLNEDHDRRVNEAITVAKQQQWPPLLESYVRTRITPLCQSSLTTQLSRLLIMTEVQKKCPSCGTLGAWTVNSFTIAHLLKNPHVSFSCVNPLCLDGRRFRTQVSIGLGDVFMSVVGSSHTSIVDPFSLPLAPNRPKKWVVVK